jgi:pilus assembly protein CpaB
MNLGSVVTILISLALAAGVAYLGNAWLERRLDAPQEPVDTVAVVAAAKDIPVDTPIDQTFLRLLQVPRPLLPAGAVTDPNELLGKVLKERVYAGEMILERRLLGDAGANVLSAVLEPGKRAITVRVNDVSGVSGFLLPGSHVDVISMRRGSKARTVLQNIKILAVGQTLQAAGEGAMPAKAVTLEVDPAQAEVLAEATDRGSVQLTLRHRSDHGFVEAVAERQAPIAADETPVAPNRPSGSPGVTVIRGVKAAVQAAWSREDDDGAEAAPAPQVIR